MASQKSGKRQVSHADARLQTDHRLQTSIVDHPKGWSQPYGGEHDTMDDADLRRVGATLEMYRNKCTDFYKQVLGADPSDRDRMCGLYVEAQSILDKKVGEAFEFLMTRKLKSETDPPQLLPIRKLLCIVAEQEPSGAHGEWRNKADAKPATYMYQGTLQALESATFSPGNILSGLSATLREDTSKSMRECAALAMDFRNSDAVRHFAAQPAHGHRPREDRVRSRAEDETPKGLGSHMEIPALTWKAAGEHGQGVEISVDLHSKLTITPVLPSQKVGNGVCFDHEKAEVVGHIMEACAHMPVSLAHDLVLQESEHKRFHVMLRPQGYVAQVMSKSKAGARWVAETDVCLVDDASFDRSSNEAALTLIMKRMNVPSLSQYRPAPSSTAVSMVKRLNGRFLHVAFKQGSAPPDITYVLALTWTNPVGPIRQPKVESTQALKDAIADVLLSKANPSVLFRGDFVQFHNRKTGAFEHDRPRQAGGGAHDRPVEAPRRNVWHERKAEAQARGENPGAARGGHAPRGRGGRGAHTGRPRGEHQEGGKHPRGGGGMRGGRGARRGGGHRPAEDRPLSKEEMEDEQMHGKFHAVGRGGRHPQYRA
jgi:hypothetical protein